MLFPHPDFPSFIITSAQNRVDSVMKPRSNYFYDVFRKSCIESLSCESESRFESLQIWVDRQIHAVLCKYVSLHLSELWVRFKSLSCNSGSNLSVFSEQQVRFEWAGGWRRILSKRQLQIQVMLSQDWSIWAINKTSWHLESFRACICIRFFYPVES